MFFFKKGMFFACLAIAGTAGGSYQNGQFFADSVHLINNTQDSITIINDGKSLILKPQGTITVSSATQFIYLDHLFSLFVPRPDLTKPSKMSNNRATLDINSLAYSANVYEHSNGLDQIILDNDTYYPAELCDLDDQTGQPAITINPGEKFAKNAASSTLKRGTLLVTILAERHGITYPRRLCLPGMAQTLDFRSSTITLNTLVEIKRYGIQVNAKPINAKALAKLARH